ncbi:multiple epidermal growth factor-like domains protein 6 isoform X2 [Mizuhopecten yessoensis]|uniref:multiple epidermal growth factor-like domains protein 6 isoform X2 n=1 Tax=Mizuhopecten yessoensis TaxID=6573 RepID=UPI000B45E194|nr:multiple epidermal growth factor-like domains protein 6 isoform X2 [Mizuhopecten yessoensis]
MEDGKGLVLLLTLCVSVFSLCCCQSSTNPPVSTQTDILPPGENCSNCHGNCLNNTDICNGTCISGFYGDGCEFNCTSNCRYGCNRTTGSCNYCAKNYHGNFCNDSCPDNCYVGCRQSGLCFSCSSFWFGEKCGKVCPENCHYGCDAVTGECKYGCKPGYWGKESCNHTCPENCYDSLGGASCFQPTGRCTSCNPGYTGYNCTDRCKDTNCSKCINDEGIQRCYECKSGSTGTHCSGSCPAHCQGDTCDQLTGTCTCANGWYGDDCSMQCYGNCSLCVDNSTCITCMDGYYGGRCEMRCPSDCEKCSRDGKNCIGMCIGWSDNYGSLCKCRRSECLKRDPGTHNCLKCKNDSWFTQDAGCCPCSDHCNGSCDSNNGTCINGCLDDYHGPTCDTLCSSHCNGSCDPMSGECEHGCLNDWVGPTCDIQCSVNFPHCDNCVWFTAPGHEVIAYCNGCTAGYHSGVDVGCVPCDHCLNRNCTASGQCLEACVEGYHYSISHYCDEKCNENCIDRKCDNTAGNCTKGCVPGYYTERCSLDCSSYCSEDGCDRGTGVCHGCRDGMYGQYCFFTCSEHCVDHSCARESGSCSECKLGYYGNNCVARCDGCLDVTCTQTKGCEKGCMPGQHGRYCDKKCPENCYVCDQNSGACLMCNTGFSGIGYRGANCSIPCPDCVNKYENNTGSPFHGSCFHGKYGLLCMEDCGNCFTSNGVRECEKFTGYCSNGCSSGYYGMTCKDECLNCQPDINNMTVCDVTSGACQDGCLAGSFGIMCNETCGNNCLNNLCKRSNGTCSNGCSSGWQGDQCNIAKRTQNKDSSLSGGAIAGIILGVVFGVALVAGIAYFLIRRKRADGGGNFTSFNNENS